MLDPEYQWMMGGKIMDERDIAEIDYDEESDIVSIKSRGWWNDHRTCENLFSGRTKGMYRVLKVLARKAADKYIDDIHHLAEVAKQLEVDFIPPEVKHDGS